MRAQVHDIDPHPGGAGIQDSKRGGGVMGKVDLAPLDERAAVVNADFHTAAVLQISHQGQGSQRQRGAGRGQILLIVDLSSWRSACR